MNVIQISTELFLREQYKCVQAAKCYNCEYEQYLMKI
jgi:hypothetical protein